MSSLHYYGNETILSINEIPRLSPNEVRVLEWVRTYEFLENEAGEDDAVSIFLELKCVDDGVLIRRNRITDFPAFITEQEEHHRDVETALPILQAWAEDVLDKM